MKKLLYLALIAATTVGFTACGDNNDDDIKVDITPDETVDYSGNYSGDMVVSAQMYGVSTVISESEDVSYSTLIKNDAITITMNKIKFIDNMPVTLDIVLPNIPEVAEDSYVYYIDTVVPTTLDGEPYDTSILVSIENVEVTVGTEDRTLNISYICNISTEALGDMACYVEYSGVKE